MNKIHSIKSTPYHTENPFMKSVIIEMDSNTQVLAAGDNSGQRINKNDAVIWKNKVIKDKRKFIKLYHNGLKDFFGLNRCEMDLLKFIMHRIRKDQDKVAFTYKILKEESDFSGDSSIARTLLGLITKGIIARAETDGIYYINPNIFFNGDRVAFVKSYIMENVKSKDSSTNTIENTKEEIIETPTGLKGNRQEYQREDSLFG
tara:strand:+ start:8108 stop:8716 length:609 start_codon:yes stop_codon:yes gene_type:complete